MSRAAVFSVIFPANLPYFSDYLRSLTAQSEKSFDLLLAVDTVPGIEDYLKPYRDFFLILTLPVKGSIASIRDQGLSWIKTLGYEYIIFADTDDLLSPDRVKTCCHHLDHHPLVTNDLKPFYNNPTSALESVWKNRIEHTSPVTSETILNYNIVGLGNTAVRSNVIQKINLPDSLQIVDWFLFFRLLNKNSGIFTHDGTVLYRQHSDSTAGIQVLTEERLIYIIEKKISHYTHLTGFSRIEPELKHHRDLKRDLLADDELCKRTVAYLNSLQINYFWWEETNYIV